MTTDTSRLPASVYAALTAFGLSLFPPLASLEFALQEPPGKPFPRLSSWIGRGRSSWGRPEVEKDFYFILFLMQENLPPGRRGCFVWVSLSLGKCMVVRDLGKGGRVLGGIFMGQISIPVWLRGWPISTKQIRLLGGISNNKTGISES